MLWAHCIRIDLAADASEHETRWCAAAAEPAIAALERTELVHANFAVSAGALLAFVRHGCGRLLERIGALAAARRIELLGTAAHGALLPLLPEDEIERQLELNDDANERFFGDMYRPEALWPPALAISRKVAEIAARREFSAILCDEAALRMWPARFPGDRLPVIEGMPGLFLVPCSRTISDACADGWIGTRTEIEELQRGLEPPGGPHRFIATAVELGPRTAPPRALWVAPDAEVTVRLQDLFSHFRLDFAVSPLPCSQRSTFDELGKGLPFARWFDPEEPTHALQWRLVSEAHDVLVALDATGLRAHPAVRALRETLDLSWRESWFRAGSAGERGASEVEAGVTRLERAMSGVAELVPPPKFAPFRQLATELRAPRAHPHVHPAEIPPVG